MPNLVSQWGQYKRESYRIRYIRLFEYLYEEGDHRVTIGVEEGCGNPLGDILIDRSFVVHWNAPHEDELIPDAKQEEILGRMLAYLRKPSFLARFLPPVTTRYGIISKPHWEEKERQAAIQAKEAKAKKGR